MKDKMQSWLLLGFMVIAGFSSGCTSVFKRYPYGMIDPTVSLQPLSRDQYLVLGDVTGQSRGGYLFGFIPTMMGGPKVVSGSLNDSVASRLQAPGLGKIEQQALYNALESQPDADGIIALRVIKGEEMKIPLLYTEISVTIKGKAVKIKKDKD